MTVKNKKKIYKNKVDYKLICYNRNNELSKLKCIKVKLKKLTGVRNKKMLTLVDKFQTKIGRNSIGFLVE